MLKQHMLWIAPIAAIVSGLAMNSYGWAAAGSLTVGITVLCALWWIFEPIPIPVTSLLPLSVLPMAGVLTVEQVAGAVGSPLIILLLGGFLLSRGMESSGAHHRVALSARWENAQEATGAFRATEGAGSWRSVAGKEGQPGPKWSKSSRRMRGEPGRMASSQAQRASSSPPGVERAKQRAGGGKRMGEGVIKLTISLFDLSVCFILN